MIMPPERAVNSDEQASRRDNARVCKVSGVVHSPVLPTTTSPAIPHRDSCMYAIPAASGSISVAETHRYRCGGHPFAQNIGKCQYPCSRHAHVQVPFRVMKGLSRNSASVSPSCMAAIILATSCGVKTALYLSPSSSCEGRRAPGSPRTLHPAR